MRGGARRPARDGKIARRVDLAEDVDREIRAHLAERTDELEAAGWEPTLARQEAERVFGDREEVARTCRAIANSHQRAVRRGMMLDQLSQDLRVGARMLLRSPGFAVVAVLTLALGIGANTAIFSVIRGILLRPLPYQHPERLVTVAERTNRGGTMRVAYPNFVDWRTECSSFDGLALIGGFSTTVLGGEEPLTARGATVGQDFWRVFPVRPLQGRLTLPEDHVPGAPPVVLVSRSFWQNRLGSRPLDSYDLEMSGYHVSVVGVLPDDFGYPAGADIWAPAEPRNQSVSRSAHNWSVVGRLAPGISVDQAREEVDALTKRIVAGASDEDPDFLATGAEVTPLLDNIVAATRKPLYLLLGAAGLVLLVACTNLASTLLARGANRARELAVRSSVGAGRGRIMRQLLTESLLLALIGASAGVGVGYLLVHALVTTGSVSLPRLSDVGIDGEVLAYTAVITVLTAVLFGLLPARRLTRDGAGEALRSGSRGNAIDGHGSVWRVLVGTEVALALVLLAASGLLVRSFRAVLDEDPGFDPADVDVMSMSLSQLKYPTPEDHARWYTRFLEQVRALPGVADAGVLSAVPGGGAPNGRLELNGSTDEHAIGEYVVASAGAFRALDIPLVEGRLFDDRDGPDDEHVVVVSEAFADLAWPGEDPVGRTVNGGGMDNFWQERRFARVVGVVGNVRYDGLDHPVNAAVYFPYTQRPFRLAYSASVVVEAANVDPASLFGALRSTLRTVDPDVPVKTVEMSAALVGALGQRRFLMMILGGFSLTALLLAGVGIYGVVSYSVARRTREMGIRMALGAGPESVRGLVIGTAMRMVGLGLVLGLIGAFSTSRLMRSLVYGVSPTDPISIVTAAGILGTVALMASWIPARVVTRVDPMITMRAE